MQKLLKKRNVILMLLAATFLSLVGFLFLSAPAAHADGNDAWGSDTQTIEVHLNVNGAARRQNEYDMSETDIETRNRDNNRVRYIYTGALGRKYEGVTADYSFDESSIVKSSKCIDVGVVDGNFLRIEAKKYTEETAGDGYARFSVNAVQGSETRRIYFKVKVYDSFVPADKESKEFYVGYKTDDIRSTEVNDKNEPDNSMSSGTHAAIMSINNYSRFSIDLDEYLKGRALYYGRDILEESSGLWVINSVTNFQIGNIGVDGLAGFSFTDILRSNSTVGASGSDTQRVSARIDAKVELTSKVVDSYNSDSANAGKEFWSSVHNLTLELKCISGSENNSCTLKIPVKFVPYNPQPKTISANILRLNVTSPYTYNVTAAKYVDADGNEVKDVFDYSAIKISPSDLIEYSYPASFAAPTFVHTSTKLNDKTDLNTQEGCRIDIPAGQNEYFPDTYIIKSSLSNQSDTSHKINFDVRYQVDSHEGPVNKTIAVEINVSTYGGYTVSFAPINGKDSVEYSTLDSGVFAQMRDLGYHLTSAKSNNEEQLGVYLSQNVLTLSPKVDNINGQASATVQLTFTNREHQTIRFDSEVIDIDVNAGSLFSRFDDWQAWLIIAGAILGGIIVILIIVWIFIRAISKRREAEAATQAPVSSYIVKLNNTIAQTQAQQRMAQTAALSQASGLLLGAGPTGNPAAIPDTLQLATGSGSMSTPASPSLSEPQATSAPDKGEDGEDLNELIARYITDEELLERIFTEKYEAKGMVRRTFFKSKDLQARELEKEKKRIIERYKSPMPMDEAIMSENEVKKAEAMSTPRSSQPEEVAPEAQVTDAYALDFDPDAPLYVEPEVKKDEFSEEKIDLDVSPEEARLKDLEHRYEIILAELTELKTRIDQVGDRIGKASAAEEELRAKIEKAEAEDAMYAKNIEDLEFKLASAKNRDKDKITRDIGINEDKKKRNLDELEKLRVELDVLLGSRDKLNGIADKLKETEEQKNKAKDETGASLDKAKADYEDYMKRLAQVKAKQELEAKVTGLVPLLEAVNNTDYELRKLQQEADEQEKERDALNAQVAAAKAQILGATDFGLISDLNNTISETNARLSALEKETSRATKRKSDLNIEFNAQRRKANDFCEKNEIPVEEVVRAEDLVIGNIELGILKAIREKEKSDAEQAVAAAHAVYDDLSSSSNDVTLIAMEVASAIQDIKDELETTQQELDAINTQMESATDDERLLLTVDQSDKADKVEELKAKLEQANIDGIKRNTEAQQEYDAKLEDARRALDEANEEFEKACASYDSLTTSTNPLDLIVSGSGVISKDQKKLEAENFKKQLEKSKNEIEAARLAAEQAQAAAEQTRLEAERAQEEARLEAERKAQEAMELAEQVKREAEEKARAEIEAAERARQEAAEAAAAEAEEARRKAQEEAEEAKRLADEQAEEARRKAQEEAEEAKRLADEQAEEARRKAKEEIDDMRRKQVEEAEAKRAEEEERLKAESARGEVIAKKVAMRKEQIIAIRNDMKELKGDEDAKNLRERLYNIQLTYDEDERGSSELMDFYNKTMDDIQNSGEIARLRAENAKKPQRIVRKVTERVNRIPKKKPRPGAAGARPGAPRPGAARPGAARPGAARPGARPPARPGAARPGAARPGARPGAPRPGSGNRPRPR